MANHATLTHCLVLVNKGSPLLGMALEASFVSAQESKAAAPERLLNIGAAAFDCYPGVRVVTIGAAHFAFQHRMMVWQLKLRPHFQVTLETSFRRLTRIDNSVRSTAALDVQTTGTVTRLTANVLRVLSFRHQPGVRRCFEITHDFFVAGPAFL
ncbi:MAG TPA: hypothetical protein VFA61_13085 [Candidatus Udaeobacter sp.]|nr:hypothetical protein [Candidatus Udaeobacter sp.]